MFCRHGLCILSIVNDIWFETGIIGNSVGIVIVLKMHGMKREIEIGARRRAIF